MSAKVSAKIEETDRKAKAILADLIPLLSFDSIATDPEFVSILNQALECAEQKAAQAKTDHRLRSVRNGNGSKPRESSSP